MFDLDTEIQHYCAGAVPRGPHHADNAAELEDHLRSTIAARVERGEDEKQAFEKATQQLGEIRMLMDEFEKNQGVVAKLCAIDRKLSGLPDDPKVHRGARRLLTGHAILWAAAMLATAWLFGDQVGSTKSATIFVFIPLWFASSMLITTTLRGLRGAS